MAKRLYNIGPRAITSRERSVMRGHCDGAPWSQDHNSFGIRITQGRMACGNIAKRCADTDNQTDIGASTTGCACMTVCAQRHVH